MYGFDSLFMYYSRRAQQEQIAAINACSIAAAAAHQQLSGLHAAEALLALAADASTEPQSPHLLDQHQPLEVVATCW